MRTIHFPEPDENGWVRFRERQVSDEQWERFSAYADEWWERVRRSFPELADQIERGPEAFATWTAPEPLEPGEVLPGVQAETFEVDP